MEASEKVIKQRINKYKINFVLIAPSASRGPSIWSSLVKLFSNYYSFSDSIVFEFVFYFQDGMLFLHGIGRKQMKTIFVVFAKRISNAVALIVPSQEINAL